jgi:HAD superfamily hydrolase (TIGR01509 family)
MACVIPRAVTTVLCDLDGTLVDTEPVGPMVAKDIFCERGSALDRSEYELFVSAWRNGEKGATREVLESFSVRRWPGAQSWVANEYYARYKQRIAQADLLAGVESFLSTAWHLGIAIGLVTSSMSEQAAKIIEAQGWENLFAVVISGNDVKELKPQPEPYRTAVELLGCKHAQVRVFEDSPLGVQSARRAGLWVVAVEQGGYGGMLGEANEVVSSFSDVSFDDGEGR